jgi:hypothetical protein
MEIGRLQWVISTRRVRLRRRFSKVGQKGDSTRLELLLGKGQMAQQHSSAIKSQMQHHGERMELVDIDSYRSCPSVATGQLLC